VRAPGNGEVVAATVSGEGGGKGVKAAADGRGRWGGGAAGGWGVGGNICEARAAGGPGDALAETLLLVRGVAGPPSEY